MRSILPFFVALLVVAFLVKADHFFTLLYALFGIYVLGRLWIRRSLAGVSVERHFERRIFLGQTLTVAIDVRSRTWLPLLWLRLSDALPGELAAGNLFRHVISLRPREHQQLSYTLTGRRRGYYRLGPFSAMSGDLLGTATYENQPVGQDYFIVYPRIVPLRDLGFPSQSPFGTLPSKERIFEDPTRIQGVREYQPGDALKRVDWKTSARVGSLQVRRYEPAISLETGIFLNLSGMDHAGRKRFTASELGIVVAASVAVCVVEKRQAVAMFTNGRDPLQVDPSPCGPDDDRATDPRMKHSVTPVARSNPGRAPMAMEGQEPLAETTLPMPVTGFPLRKGRDHLIHLLDLLARIELNNTSEVVPFQNLLSRMSLGLPWGSTVVVITPREVEGLMDTLLTLRRRGLAIILVLTSPDPGFDLSARRADQVGVQAVRVWSEQDMDVWR